MTSLGFAGIKCKSSPLCHFIDRNDDLAPMSLTGSNSDELIQPCIFLCTGLENRGGSEVVFFWIDIFPFGQAVHDFFRSSADSPIKNIDQGTIMGLQGVSRLQFRSTVGPYDLPVCASSQHLAGKSGTGKGAALDMNNPSLSMVSMADEDWRIYIKA